MFFLAEEHGTSSNHRLQRASHHHCGQTQEAFSEEKRSNGLHNGK